MKSNLLKINIQGLEKKVEAISNDIANIETEYNDLQKRNFEVVKAREKFRDECKSLNAQLIDSETQINELHKVIKKTSNSAIKMFALGGVIGFLVAEIVAHLF